MRRIFPAVFFFLVMIATAIPAGPAESPRVRAFVSILPQHQFVERVGGDRVAVDVLVQPGESPATYTPSPRQMVDLSRADVYFRIGVPFENVFIPKLQRNLIDLVIVDTRRGIRLRPIEAHYDEIEGEADPEHRHAVGSPDDETSTDATDRANLDPHIWLDPLLVKKQAETIRDALIRIDPKGEAQYRTNFQEFAKELDALHEKIRETLAPLKGREFFVYHPSYGYLADRYELKQVAVEVGGKDPTPRDVARLIEKARASGVKVIFVQPQFGRRSAQAVARAIGGAVVMLDPLARDYLNNMREMAEKIEAALRNAQPSQ